jgi:RNA polymerase sigma factor (sigma-70 family)
VDRLQAVHRPTGSGHDRPRRLGGDAVGGAETEPPAAADWAAVAEAVVALARGAGLEPSHLPAVHVSLLEVVFTRYDRRSGSPIPSPTPHPFGCHPWPLWNKAGTAGVTPIDMPWERQPRFPMTATAYEQHRDYVLAVLRHRCGWLDPSDREALLHDAYIVLLEKQHEGHLDVEKMRAAQVRAYLTQTALNKAMDESKRMGRRRTVSLDDESLMFDPVSPGLELDEQLAVALDRRRVREIVADLPERQQAVITLRLLLDRTPEEIQRRLGVTSRIYRRELETGLRQVAEQLELHRRGAYCASRRSLLLAWLAGVAGPRRVHAARRHLADCPACARWVHQQAHAEIVENRDGHPTVERRNLVELAARRLPLQAAERPPAALAA